MFVFSSPTDYNPFLQTLNLIPKLSNLHELGIDVKIFNKDEEILPNIIESPNALKRL